MTNNGTVTQEYKNTILGTIYIVHSVIYIIPYIPCAITISRKPLIENSCFKIMAAMALPDIIQLLISGPYCGIMSILGVPMEDYYQLSKLWGALTNVVWIVYGSLNVLLAFNRCVDLRSSTLATRLFGGRKAWGWIGGCYLCAIVIGIVFSTDVATLLYHPGLGVFVWADPTAFMINTIFNWTFGISLPILYIVVWVFLREKMQAAANHEQFNDKERRMVLQAFLISLFVFLTAVMYVTLPLTNIEARHFWIAHVIWQIMSGCNVIIYLVINPTIRKKVWNMICCVSPQVAAAAVTPLAHKSPGPARLTPRPGSTREATPRPGGSPWMKPRHQLSKGQSRTSPSGVTATSYPTAVTSRL